MKYKDCCMNKKNRELTGLIGYREKFKGMRHGADGSVEILTLDDKWVVPDHVHTEFGYKREGGKKKVTTFIHDAHVRDPSFLSYLRTFDAVFAVDTNTREINGTNIAVSCAYQIFIEEEKENGDVPVGYLGPMRMCFKNGYAHDGSDEKFGILMLVQVILRGGECTEKTRIAIITDHDLANHSRYNKQELPIYKNGKLPNIFTLMYASADKKNDNMPTHAVSRCDEEAGKELDFFEETGFFAVGGYAIPLEQLIDVDNHSGRVGFPVYKQQLS